MNDLEKELQMMMQEKAAQVSPPDALPRRTLRRARGRQASFASGAVAAIVVTAVGLISAAELFGGSGDKVVAPVATPSRPSCSSAGLSSELEAQPGLPPEVEATRQALVEAAVRCDYEALAALTGGRPMYSLNYDGQGNFDAPPAAEYWRELDEEHTIGGKPAKAYLFDPMRVLVQLLKTPHAEFTTPEGERYFIWPSVDGDPKELTDADWDALATVYSEEEVRDMRKRVEQGGPYFGYSVSINEDGTWNAFTAGD